MAGNYDSTLGIIFIATMIGSSLWGVSCLQLYWYFNSYQQDPKWLKALVFATWSLETLHHIFLCHAHYFHLVINWGAIPPTTRIGWSVHALTLVSPVSAFIVQSFFMFRIWRLSKRSIIITTPVAVLVLAQFICYLVYAGKVYATRIEDYSQLASLHELNFAQSVLTAISDMSLAITLTYLLCKLRIGFEHSDTMIKKLIVFMINTSLLTSSNALFALIAYLTSPHTFIYILFYFIMARLYVNSLLANLNARKIVNGNSSYTESRYLSSLQTLGCTGVSGPLSLAREEQATHDISVKFDTALETRGV